MDYFTVFYLAYGIKNPLFIYELNPGHVCNYEECEHCFPVVEHEAFYRVCKTHFRI